MTRAHVGRTIVAALASYLTIAIMVGATEQLLSLHVRSHAGALPLSYRVVDLISQFFYTVVAGYLCNLIAPTQPLGLAGLIGLGLCIGIVSLITAWKTEPHWYAIGLLASYAPCVWIGWAFRSHQRAKSLSPVTSLRRKDLPFDENIEE